MSRSIQDFLNSTPVAVGDLGPGDYVVAVTQQGNVRRLPASVLRASAGVVSLQAYLSRLPETDLTDAQFFGLVGGVLRRGAIVSAGLPEPPDQTGNWAYVSLAGQLQWLELVEVTGGSVPTAVDGTASTVGTTASAEAGTATAVGAGVATASGSESTSEAGASAPSGTGIVAATGTESAAETGTATAYVLNPGTALATGTESTAETGAAVAAGTGTTGTTGAESTAETGTATATVVQNGSASATGVELNGETGTASATGVGIATATGTAGASETGTSAPVGTGIVGAAGSEGTSEAGTATASAASSGTATAVGSEGTAQAGTGTATGSGTVAAVGVQGTSETGTATASGGGGSATIAENFDTAIALTYSGPGGYPSDMATTATVQGWTIASSGTDPGTFAAYDTFVGASVGTEAVGFSGNGLVVTGCRTEDADFNVLARSGYKVSKTWSGPFASGTFSIKYKVATGAAVNTIKINGVSVGALTQNTAWQTATISLTSPANILLEIECAPTTNQIALAPQIVIDSITYS